MMCVEKVQHVLNLNPLKRDDSTGTSFKFTPWYSGMIVAFFVVLLLFFLGLL